jgi:hypothetical protein
MEIEEIACHLKMWAGLIWLKGPVAGSYEHGSDSLVPKGWGIS